MYHPYITQNSPPPSVPTDTTVEEFVAPYTPTPVTADDPILSITPLSLLDLMLIETYYLYPTCPTTPIIDEENEGPIETQQELMIPPPPSPIMIDRSHTPPSHWTAFRSPPKYRPGWVPQPPANTTLPVPPPQPNLGRTGCQRHRKYFRGPRLFSAGLPTSPLHNNPPAFPDVVPSTSMRTAPPGEENYKCRHCKIVGHRHSRCPTYKCAFCHKFSPGHLTVFCPTLKEEDKPILRRGVSWDGFFPEMKKLEDILNARHRDADYDHDLYKCMEELDLDLHWWTDVDNVYVEDHVFDNC